MTDLNWANHDKAITGFVRSATNFYLRTEASTGEMLKENQGILLRNNYATPARIKILLTYLSVLSGMVDKKIQAMPNPESSPVMQTIIADYDAWMGRLAEYRTQTDAAIARNPDASGDEDPAFWDNVTKPLLLGLYPGQEYQTKLDLVTPLTLAWQIEVVKDAYDEATSAFWKDLRESADNFVDTGLGVGFGLAVLGLAALAFGYGYAKGK